MPNHVKNVIKIHENVPHERVDVLLGAVLSPRAPDARDEPELVFDFNKLIPMPEELNLEAGTNSDRALKLYASYKQGTLRNWNAVREEDLNRWELGEKLYENVQKYGAPTWYEWCRKMWGTKWNAYRNNIMWESRTIVFETAWNCPFPIVEELARRFPDVDFTWSYADEDCGYNSGYIMNVGGTLRSAELPGGSSEAYEMYVKCWGKDHRPFCFYRDSNGALYCHNCNNCPNSDKC